MNSLPTLLTARLILRPLREEDAPRIAELAGNWNVAQMTRRIPHPYPVTLAQQFIVEQRKAFFTGREWLWGICLKDNGTGSHPLIGCIGSVFGEMDAELGYWLGEPFWGQGLATEAGRTVVDHVFAHSELWEMIALHQLANTASGRILTKLGFQVTGFKRGTCREAEQELVSYRLLRAAWIARPDRESFV